MRGTSINRRTLVIGTMGAVAGAILLPSTPSWGADVGPALTQRRSRDFAVRDFGAVPDSPDDVGPSVRAALAAAAAWIATTGEHCRARVVFEPGTYRVGAADGGAWYALEVFDTQRISLVGNGAEVLITDPHVGALSIARSQDIDVEDLVVDYATPPFTQGTITAVDATTGTFDFTPMSGYPDFTDTALFPGVGYGTLRDAATGRMKRGGQISFGYSTVTALGGGVWRVSVAPEHRGGMGVIAVGDGYVAGYRGDRNGIALYRSSDVVLRKVTVHAAPGAAFIAAECESTVISDSTVAIRPSSSRWISSNADGVHNPGGRIGPQILRNRFEDMHDDGINIYSKARLVSAVAAGGVSLVLSGGPMHIAVGDTLQACDSGVGLVRGTALVTAVTGDALAGGPVTVVLDAVIPGLQAGDETYNLDFAASGFLVEGNVITENRGLGVCIRASDGAVIGNELSDTAHWGMWVGNNSGYQEGPVGVHDVAFTANSISRPCLDTTLTGWPTASAAIMIQNFDSAYEDGVSRVHHDITISGTVIEDPPRFGIFLGGVTGVAVSETTVVEHAGNPRAAAPTAMIGIVNADGVAVSNLLVTQPSPLRDEVWLGASVTGYTRT